MTSIAWYLLAACGEIGGCFAFWEWQRSGKSAWLTIPGAIALVLFALALTRVDTPNAGRAYASYGGIYIVASILWLWRMDGVVPDRWDLLGASVALAGAGIILWGPRG